MSYYSLVYDLDSVYQVDDDLDNDPLFWAMLFDFGRIRMEKGDQVIASMWKTNYLDYIASDIWKAKADEAKENADNKCQLCSSAEKLRVHHRTYERLGKEPQGDLITLCSDCHEKFHSKG